MRSRSAALGPMWRASKECAAFVTTRPRVSTSLRHPVDRWTLCPVGLRPTPIDAGLPGGRAVVPSHARSVQEIGLLGDDAVVHRRERELAGVRHADLLVGELRLLRIDQDRGAGGFSE